MSMLIQRERWTRYWRRRYLGRQPAVVAAGGGHSDRRRGAPGLQDCLMLLGAGVRAVVQQLATGAHSSGADRPDGGLQARLRAWRAVPARVQPIATHAAFCLARECRYRRCRRPPAASMCWPRRSRNKPPGHDSSQHVIHVGGEGHELKFRLRLKGNSEAVGISSRHH